MTASQKTFSDNTIRTETELWTTKNFQTLSSENHLLQGRCQKIQATSHTRDSKSKISPMTHDSPKPYVEAFRDKLKQRGARGIIGLQRIFKIIDDDGSKSLSKSEFSKACKDFRVDMPPQGADIIFGAFDINGDGVIDYDEFLRIVRGPLTKPRLAYVIKAFEKLDTDGSGVIELEEIKERYNTSKHPDVISGKKTSDQVLIEFMETFEMHHANMHNGRPDGRITQDEFVEYYTNVSASLDNDEYFSLMMNNSWNLNGDANTYKKYEKGWSNLSPEKKQQKAGEKHNGYSPGKLAENMVVQRSGMMSGENPLSSTSRYYHNPYDSKRQVNSVANNPKEKRDTYERPGTSSKNNPLASNTSNYYESTKGKPISDFESAPIEKKPKFQTYMLNRIKQKCVQRGERGLFQLNRTFKTFDSNGNGILEFTEFASALKSFQLDLEDYDIENIFKSFDNNGDGVLQFNEFLDLVLGQLSMKRQQVVQAAWSKLDSSNRGFVSLRQVKDTFDASRHPDVCNGRRSEEEAINEFLEIYDMHHNCFNDYQKNDKVTQQEFNEFYRTLSAAYEEDVQFEGMVKGVWGIKFSMPDAADRTPAGGKDEAGGSRARYQQMNQRGTPFGTAATGTQEWQTSTKHNYAGAKVDSNAPVAGGMSRQAQYIQEQQMRTAQMGDNNSGQALMEKFRERMRQRGARGILGLKRIFKIMDDDRSGFLDTMEFNKALRDYRVQVSPEEGERLFSLFDLNGDGTISYDELLRGVVGEMNQFRQNFVQKAFKKLDKNGNGIVEIDDIKDTYNAKQHPDVKLGKKTEDEVLSEFLDTFELHYSLQHPDSKDRKISFEEFIEYYNNVSMSIEDDRYFELMITNAWNLNNVSYGKGWGGEV